MSWTKRQLERQMDEGCASIGEKWVCPRCFEDYAIRRFIRENACFNICSYCSRRSRKPIATEINDVLSFIAEGLNREYEPPENHVPWDSAEGGWQLPVHDAREILSE